MEFESCNFTQNGVQNSLGDGTLNSSYNGVVYAKGIKSKPNNSEPL